MLETTQQIINGFPRWNQFLHLNLTKTFSLEVVYFGKK